MSGTEAERFWAKVDRRGPDQCWPWTGARNAEGYGSFRRAGGRGSPRVRATHVALEFAGRPLPAGKLAMHSCDNPPCVNPGHLSAGTHQENDRDAIRKGRKPTPRLSDDDVRAIRASRHLASGFLAGRYGVTSGYIRDIWYGRTRRHVTDEAAA